MPVPQLVRLSWPLLNSLHIKFVTSSGNDKKEGLGTFLSVEHYYSIFTCSVLLPNIVCINYDNLLKNRVHANLTIASSAPVPVWSPKLSNVERRLVPTWMGDHWEIWPHEAVFSVQPSQGEFNWVSRLKAQQMEANTTLVT